MTKFDAKNVQIINSQDVEPYGHATIIIRKIPKIEGVQIDSKDWSGVIQIIHENVSANRMEVVAGECGPGNVYKPKFYPLDASNARHKCVVGDKWNGQQTGKFYIDFQNQPLLMALLDFDDENNVPINTKP